MVVLALVIVLSHGGMSSCPCCSRKMYPASNKRRNDESSPSLSYLCGCFLVLKCVVCIVIWQHNTVHEPSSYPDSVVAFRYTDD